MTLKSKLVCAALALATPAIATGTDSMFEDFAKSSRARWDYVSDQVMGGVSNGTVAFAVEGETHYVRLTGEVSTEKNGGFIQVRRLLGDGMPGGMTGLRLRTRGNGQEYFLHIRTEDSNIPWFYYQAAFKAHEDWHDVAIPLADFEPSSAALPGAIDPGKITSVGIVAYGRDHVADVSVATIEVY